MITGSYPPDPCGVGGYTHGLADALKQRNCDVEVFTGRDFGTWNAHALAREIAQKKPDLVHIQYPTTGYGTKLGPQVLSMLLSPCVVTLHEVSQVNFLRRLALYPFALRSAALVFTNEYEKAYAGRFAPWVRTRSKVIPIGSAIPSTSAGTAKDLDEIVHFGLIRPRKGLERVLELARRIKEANLPYRVRIIGTAEERFRDYLRELQAASADLPMLWNLDCSEEEVSILLARSKVAYMPFPDGASERRSSLLALLANNVAAVTNVGPFTPAEMTGVVEFADSPDQALSAIAALFAGHDHRAALISGMQRYMGRREWPQIAAEHEMLYRSVLKMQG